MIPRGKDVRLAAPAPLVADAHKAGLPAVVRNGAGPHARKAIDA